MDRIDQLIQRKKELRDELTLVNREIEKIQDNCPHTDKFVIDSWRDGYECRTYNLYYCPDCKRKW